MKWKCVSTNYNIDKLPHLFGFESPAEKTDISTAQSSHFLHSIQPHTAITFVWILAHCANLSHDVDRATKLYPDLLHSPT